MKMEVASFTQLILVIFIMTLSCCGRSMTSSAGNEDVSEKLMDIASRLAQVDDKLDVLSRSQDQQSLLTTIDQRLTSIEQKLDILTNQERPTAPDTSHEGGGEQESNAKEVEEATTQDQEEFPYFNCVDLISVERNPTDEGNRFTIKFKKNAEEIFFRYHDDRGPEKVPDTVEEGDGGVWSVSFTCGNTTQFRMSPWFTIGDKVDEEGWSLSNTRHMVHIRLNNSGISHGFQEIAALPQLHVEPPRAAFYPPGEDFNVTVFVPLNHESPQVNSHIYESMYGINLADGKAYMDMDRSEIFVELEETSDSSMEKKSVTLLTSKTAVSGYLSFSYGVDLEGPTVQRVQVNRVIEVRPANQTTLPSGYLAVLENPHRERSKNGNEQRECRLGVECNFYCYGAGESITSMSVSRVLPDGSQEPVPSAIEPKFSMGMDTMKAVYWSFSQDEEGLGDSDGITTFRCFAFDTNNFKVDTKLLDVLVLLDDGFDNQLTNVSIQDDYMDPHIKHLTFNCAVYGRPLPEVHFSGGTSYIFRMDTSEPDSVINIGQNKVVATKNVTLDLDYLRDYNYRLYEDDILPSCGIYSRTQKEYIEHIFDNLPDLGLEEK